jgi:hypothetical protein
MRALILAFCLATPATAETIFDRAAGLYGSATDPLQSCDANPHELSFIANPPHAVFRWQSPRPDVDGYMSTEDTYDLRGAGDATLDLQREGDAPLAATGHRPTWILRLTPEGYCMGRSDWSPVRCVIVGVNSVFHRPAPYSALAL